MMTEVQGGWLLQNLDSMRAVATAQLKTNDMLLRQLIDSSEVIVEYGQRLLSGEPITEDERNVITLIVSAVQQSAKTFSEQRERIPEKIGDLNVAAAKVDETRRLLKRVVV